MVIWPVRVPVAVGVKVTWIEQFPPAVTVVFWQLSVSLKSRGTAIAVGLRARLPVFFKMTVCGLLAVSETWLGKISESGLAVAIVRPVPADHSGVCHTPRPYVPAVSTCAAAVGGAALNSVTGAWGSPLPNADQQVEGRIAQEDI
jgi:hypothetical protein